ncbi:hypothetical protein P280DRAFT_484584 [Massarina eburnea CBS 473.64]|uniref:Uncharacterized protein n=1 Tax=Massarina eburnea CBS 473.64 TaxID=1395130 RepID=A0A6A6RKI4_9PLEO|nr:hypothetical protein P280DRAFT_484584 [Massarina eburnea CBS 473.64]
MPPLPPTTAILSSLPLLHRRDTGSPKFHITLHTKDILLLIFCLLVPTIIITTICIWGLCCYGRDRSCSVLSRKRADYVSESRFDLLVVKGDGSGSTTFPSSSSSSSRPSSSRSEPNSGVTIFEDTSPPTTPSQRTTTNPPPPRPLPAHIPPINSSATSRTASSLSLARQSSRGSGGDAVFGTSWPLEGSLRRGEGTALPRNFVRPVLKMNRETGGLEYRVRSL